MEADDDIPCGYDCSQTVRRNSKTLTVANQTEVPILHYANIILNTTIDENSRCFSVPFAVADIKYPILGTPFFEDNIQNINIQDFHSNSNTNQRHTQIMQSSSQHSYLKIIHISLTSIELPQKLKYV